MGRVTVAFYWKVSSEANHDWLSFYAGIRGTGYSGDSILISGGVGGFDFVVASGSLVPGSAEARPRAKGEKSVEGVGP
jgi:hypothetical protein